MRQRLLEHLTSGLESYVKFRATNPLALYVHVPKYPLTYPELEGKRLTLSIIFSTYIIIVHFEGCQITFEIGNRCANFAYLWTDLTLSRLFAESVFSAPFYIQNLLNSERFPQYQINYPNVFLNSLMQVRRHVYCYLLNLYTLN